MTIDLLRRSLSTYALVAILVVAAILLLGWPGLAEFKLDEAAVSRQALDLAHNGIWPSPTDTDIAGLPQPPGKAFLLAIPYALTRDPRVAIIFQGLLGVATVWLTYLFGARYFNKRVGLLAALLYATTPWAIFFTRKLWPQNVPFFTILMMFGVYGFAVDRKASRLGFALLTLGILASFYLGDLILGLILLLAAALGLRTVMLADKGPRWKSLAWIAAGGIGFLLILAPYIVEIATGRVQPGIALESASVSGRRQARLAEQINLAAAIGTGDQFYSLAGDKAQEFITALPAGGGLGVLDVAAVWVVVAGMAYVSVRAGFSLFRLVKQPASASPDSHTYFLLAMWAVVPIALWTLSGLTPYIHRYIMLFPTQALVIAVLLVDFHKWLAGRGSRLSVWAFRVVAGAWLATLVVWHIVLYRGMLDFVQTHSIVGGHGRPVEFLWSAATRIRGLASANHDPIVIHTSGDNPDQNQDAAGFDVVLGDFDLYLISNPILEVLPFRDYVWVKDNGDGTYQIERHTGLPTPQEQGLARLANGIDILRVEPRTGNEMLKAGRVMLSLTYRVWGTPPVGKEYGYSVQLYSASDAALGSQDGGFLRSRYWRPGDTIRIQVEIPVGQPDALIGGKILTSMYAYLGDSKIEGVDILDVAGNPSGQQVILAIP